MNYKDILKDTEIHSHGNFIQNHIQTENSLCLNLCVRLVFFFKKVTIFRGRANKRKVRGADVQVVNIFLTVRIPLNILNYVSFRILKLASHRFSSHTHTRTHTHIYIYHIYIYYIHKIRICIIILGFHRLVTIKTS